MNHHICYSVTTVYDIIIAKETKNQIIKENQKAHQHT